MFVYFLSRYIIPYIDFRKLKQRSEMFSGFSNFFIGTFKCGVGNTDSMK